MENLQESLGRRIAQLRYRQQLKQSDLAQDAEVSLRTIQRLEAGEVVKTDALIKVLKRLGRAEDFLSSLDLPELSPYELLDQAGLKSTDLDNPKALAKAQLGTHRSGSAHQKRRVRGSASKMRRQAETTTSRRKPSEVQWPEDKVS